MMEVNGKTSDCNEKRPLENSTLSYEQKNPAESSTNTSVFVNHAAIAWDESRRNWVGDASQKSLRTPKDPTINWSTTYEDLLSTTDPFPQPIPLADMVDFLVDIWHDEGLFD
ncbi:uncharacterized protein LOC105174185 [Sesamum indicum]|uniref:Uncharacterized protein LOC105174185 n=1 Tax=Sesamum indicum TaxID=4182 RepID=A0A6I9U2L0_SESIN|nr:uncharacterized protein LOC105174185 [Sesamum indicum]XP_011094508.1 uncharacterized protein LOC105174185 [Sesamum indicum]XP_020553340.1 uncharacterized protein LOC105174185 [Sesamum indicum]